MQKLKFILPLSFLLNSYAATATKDAALLLKSGQKIEAIKLLEERFSESTDEAELGEISYLLSLNPDFETTRSMSYYIANALDKYKNLDDSNKARLTRILADKSFEKGELKKALEYYDKSLNLEGNANLRDYLTLQKTWVLVNLNESKKALNILFEFITTQKSQIIGSMVYDFGRLYAEALSNKKIQSNSFNLKLIPIKEEFISGLYAGIARVNLDSQLISHVLDSYNIYNDFYDFGLSTKRISSLNKCSLLNWKLPSALNQNLVSNISKELIKCSSHISINKAEISKYYSLLLKSNIVTNELALLASFINDQKSACRQYESLLDSSYNEENFQYFISNCLNENTNKTIVDYTRVNKNQEAIKVVFGNESYKNHFTKEYKFSEKDSVSFTEIALTSLLLGEKKMPAEAYALIKKESLKYCFYFDYSCTKDDTIFTFKHLTPTEQIIYTLNFIKNKNFEEAKRILLLNKDLLENQFIASQVYLSALNFKGLYSDDFFKALSGESLLKGSNLNSKILKKRLGSFWSDSIDTLVSLQKTKTIVKNLKSIERQDRAFRSITNLQRKLASQKWPNEATKDLVLNSYKELLTSAIETLSKNESEISSIIEAKLRSWQENI